jgi:hypothetical protein
MNQLDQAALRTAGERLGMTIRALEFTTLGTEILNCSTTKVVNVKLRRLDDIEGNNRTGDNIGCNEWID